MQENLNDRTVIIIIISTILLVFLLIFTSLSSNKQLDPSIQWKDEPSNISI